MNNVAYTPREIYAITGDMCYDNKVMVNTSSTSIPDQPSLQHTRVRIPDLDTADTKPQKRGLREWLRRSRRAPLVSNTVILVIVAILLAVLEFGIIPQTKLGFYCKDPKISLPYRGEIVTTTILLITCCILPLAVIALVEFLRGNPVNRIDWRQVWFYYREFLIGVTIVLMLTEVSKVLVGEHRPHFIDTCEPDVMNTCQKGTYVFDYTCTSTEYSWYFVNDASRSFPSGHAAASTFVGFFLAYIIYQRLPTFKTGRLLRPFLILACLTYTLLCSLTRITDNRHHWWDVLAGAVLGASGVLYTVTVMNKKVKKKTEEIPSPPRITSSTTTLVDVKSKDGASICIPK